jgi:signal transduction histidine kinase
MNAKLINLLLVEGDSSDCHFFKQALSDCSKIMYFDVETTQNLSETLERLNSKDFDIILLNMELSDSSGIDTVEKINSKSPHTPVLVITEPLDEETAVEAIKKGADDYLIKGKVFKDVLGRSIYYALERRKEHDKAEKRLAKLIEDLQSVNKELKDFAYVVSHDLKAPLRAIKILADWLATDYTDKLGQNGKEQIDLLISRVDRMHKLIDGILQYSRIGRRKERPVYMDLNELIPKIIETLGHIGNIKIEVKNQLPTIFAEQSCIFQIFQNLLSNAVKYMDKPNGQIEVASSEQDGCWKFAVTDNGKGIEPKNFEKIFQIFQTLTPKDQMESIGVGLTIVKKIVETYGGRIWVESQLGIGSSFCFTLPKSKQQTVQEMILTEGIAN